jgi:hypothetical protein
MRARNEGVMLRSQKRRLEALEMRLCLTTDIGFAQHDIDEAPRNGSSSMILADLDTDGDLDYVSDNFWRSNDGTGQFGDEQLMFSAGIVDKLLAADFDGDGDVDIIVSSRVDGVRQLKSFQNLDGRGRFGPGITLPTVDSSPFTAALEAGDFDGDGDLDLIEGGGAPTQIFLNTDGQGGFQLAASNAIHALSISVYDVDADGIDEAIAVTQDRGVAVLELIGD